MSFGYFWRQAVNSYQGQKILRVSIQCRLVNLHAAPSMGRHGNIIGTMPESRVRHKIHQDFLGLGTAGERNVASVRACACHGRVAGDDEAAWIRPVFDWPGSGG